MIEWFNLNQGFVMSILTFVYVVSTIGILLSARNSNKMAWESISRTTRPFISVDLYPENNFVYLRLKNNGITPAIDVSVILETSLKIFKDNILNEKKLNIIAPNTEIKFFLDQRNSFLTRNKSMHSINGKILYKNPYSQIYEESLILDIDICAEAVNMS